MTAWYNEVDPFAAEWLRHLIAGGHIADGVVDTRSIEDVHPHELRTYTQCHFFAGIGIWSAALRDAGWPDDQPVWTGSCQPFSTAGKGGGFADERHLWPAWDWLIDKCRPDLVFGEQVAAKPGLAWFDLVSSDLEGKGYTVGAADLCAAGVGAPHIRQRLWWVAHRDGRHPSPERQQRSGEHGQQQAHGGSGEWVADDDEAGQRQQRSAGLRWPELHDVDGCGEASLLADGGQQGLEVEREQHARAERSPAERGGEAEPLANNNSDRPGAGRRDDGDVRGLQASQRRPEDGAALSGRGGFWSDPDWIACRDGKWRPVEPGTFPLAHGAPGRVGRLRGYGNSIVRPLAAAFIAEALACIG